MRKKLLALVLSITLVLPYLSINAIKAYALSSVTTVSNSANNVLAPSLSPDASGYLHAVWFELDPNSSNDPNPGIYYSRWNGDTWSSPLQISSNTRFAEYPTIATDNTNNVYSVWDEYTDNGPVIRYASRTSGNNGIWSAVQSLSLPSGAGSARLPQIAIDNASNPNVVYSANTNGNQDSIYVTKLSGGSWSSPTALSYDTNGTTLLTDVQWSQLKSDGSGNLYLTYWSTGHGIYYRKFSGGSWSTPFKVSSQTNTQFVRMSVTPLGQVFTAWFIDSNNSIIERHTVSGSWQTETTLTNNANIPAFNSAIFGVTTDSKERGYVGWGINQGNGIDVQYKAFSSGSWSSANTVTTGVTDAMMPFVIGDKWDNQHFMWAEKDAGTGLFKLNYRAAEGTTQSVGTGGGTVTANPFGVTPQATLTIPPGALSSPTQIALQIGPVPDIVNPNQITIPKAYTFRPSGTTFSTPATARIFYTQGSNSDIPAVGVDESQLKPWLWDSQNSTWSAQTVVSRNTTNNTMDVSLTHFSLYGISAPIVNTVWGTKPGDKIVPGDDVEYIFNLSYADGSPFIMPVNPDDLVVNLKDANGNILDSDQFKKGQLEYKKDGKETGFKGKLHSKKLSGNYTLEVVLRGSLMSTISITAK